MYDVIIIGAGISGLMCANILSRLGLTVLILEKEPKIGGMLQGFCRNGVSFDTGFHYVGGLGGNESFEWVFRYHGLLDLPWKRLDYSEEVIINGRQYLIPCGWDSFVEGMSLYFPDQTDALKEYVNIMKGVCSGIRRFDENRIPLYEQSASLFIESTIADKELRRVLESMGLRMEMRLESLPFYEYAQINAPFIESAWRLECPSSRIVECLAERVKMQGGEIVCNEKVDFIASHEVRSEGRTYKAGIVISTIHPARTVAITPGLRKAYSKRISSLTDTYGVFTTYVCLKPEQIPYVNHSISIDNNVFIHYYVPRGEPEWADRMEIMMPVTEWPLIRGEAYRDWKRTMASKCLRLAESRVPGLKNAIDDIVTSSPLTWERYTGSSSAFGVRKDYNSVLTTLLSPQTPLQGLWLIGQSVGLHGLMGTAMTVINTLSTIYGFDTIRKELSL